MSLFQLLVAVFGSIAVMVAWLIVYHHLWERIPDQSAAGREQVRLFNASTVLTLAIGLGYAMLYVINLTAAAVVVTSEVFGQYVGPDPGVGDYALVVLLVTAAATIAGAIGRASRAKTPSARPPTATVNANAVRLRIVLGAAASHKKGTAEVDLDQVDDWSSCGCVSVV